MEKTRSSKEIKRSLLRRAFSENRGAEMIAEINHRVRRSKITPEHKALLEKFNAANENQPQAVRALNVRAEMDGEKVRYSDSVLMAPTDGPVH